MKRLSLTDVGTVIVLLIGLVFTVIPFVYMISSSFKTNTEIFSIPITYIPKHFRLDNYARLFHEIPFARQYLNSTFLATVQTLGVLVIASLSAFGYAMYRFPGRDVLFVLVLATMMIPQQMGLVPLFILMYRLGWLDSYWAVIVPGLANAFGIFFLRQVMVANIPLNLLDAARIDGASEFTIFARIALPLCKAGLGILGILTFMGSWNNFIWPLIVLRSEHMYTVPIGLASLVNLYRVEYGMVMAGSLLATLPALIMLTLLGQRYFVSGIALGAIKG